MLSYCQKALISAFLAISLSTQMTLTKTWAEYFTSKNLITATATISTTMIIIRAIYLNYTQSNELTTEQEHQSANENDPTLNDWQYSSPWEHDESWSAQDAFDRTEQAIIQFNLDYY